MEIDFNMKLIISVILHLQSLLRILLGPFQLLSGPSLNLNWDLTSTNCYSQKRKMVNGRFLLYIFGLCFHSYLSLKTGVLLYCYRYIFQFVCTG